MDVQQKVNLINSIARATDQELEHLGEKHSCIYASAVLLEVLKVKGFADAYPLTVKPVVLNPPFVERLKTQPFPDDPETQAKWAQDGCCMINIGGGNAVSTDRQWAGHLVVTLPNFFDDRHAICDLTITQASKPEWGINLVPTFVRVPASFVNGETEFKAPVNGSFIVYKAFPEDHSFESASVWTNQTYRDLAVKNILARLNAEQIPTSTQMSSRQNTHLEIKRKIGRNEPCPCGSGKKYKHCHGT